jgi:sigma-B regulation protein RsbU (phosphoserine phosphatase)
VFLLADGWQLEELDFALNTIRASLDARLVDARVRGSFREATEIQQSLLVEEPPDFAGFEIAARSLPAEEVGGDFYDFHDLGEGTLGLAIGDASGHGLPAALLVRDVVTGLRMGIEKELKVAHVFEKLNRVIHRSRLSSRFISVFYAELEHDGNLVYVNAGHQPPILFFREQLPDKVSEIELSNGGTVIGPLPEAHFHRGFARLRPGEVLLLLTDGILERRDKVSEFFGDKQVRDVVRRHQSESAETILAKLFDAASAWGDGRPWEDDATIVVVKRLSS